MSQDSDDFHDRVAIARAAKMGHRPPDPPPDDTTAVNERWRRENPVAWNAIFWWVVGIGALVGYIGAWSDRATPFLVLLAIVVGAATIRSTVYLAPGFRDFVMGLLGYARVTVDPETEWDASEEQRELGRIHAAYARGDIDDVQLEHSIAHVLAGGCVTTNGIQSDRPRRPRPIQTKGEWR